ncbi:MAG: hypothetical protein KC561_21735, partial [Myxococcales bacterium]|nr:hypothetical protein [Myxococcales bacterium]
TLGVQSLTLRSWTTGNTRQDWSAVGISADTEVGLMHAIIEVFPSTDGPAVNVIDVTDRVGDAEGFTFYPSLGPNHLSVKPDLLSIAWP